MRSEYSTSGRSGSAPKGTTHSCLRPTKSLATTSYATPSSERLRRYRTSATPVTPSMLARLALSVSLSARVVCMRRSAPCLCSTRARAMRLNRATRLAMKITRETDSVNSRAVVVCRRRCRSRLRPANSVAGSKAHPKLSSSKRCTKGNRPTITSVNPTRIESSRQRTTVPIKDGLPDRNALGSTKNTSTESVETTSPAATSGRIAWPSRAGAAGSCPRRMGSRASTIRQRVA